MARVHLALPGKFIFQTEITVRVSDLNYGGHVGNDSILMLMQEARVNFYRSKGFKDEISLDGSIGQIVTDAVVVYKAESFLGDSITIKIGVADLTKYGFDLFYLLENKLTTKEIARGKTGIVCFDYSTRKIAPIPPNLLIALQA